MNIRLYHPDSILENNTSLLSKEHTHYIVNVMRLKRGSKLNFFNKNGEWKSEIIFLNKDRVEVRFLEKIKEGKNFWEVTEDSLDKSMRVFNINKSMKNELLNLYKILSPYDESIGWINKKQVSFTFYQNPKTQKPCD